MKPTHYQYKIRQRSTGLLFQRSSWTSKDGWSVVWTDYDGSKTFGDLGDAEGAAKRCCDLDDIEIVEFEVSEKCIYAPDCGGKI